MKIILSLVCTFMLFGTMQSQKKKAIYPKAIFVKNDNSEMNVYYVSHTYPNGRVYTYMHGSDIINFEYKLSLESNTEKIKASELKLVKFIDEYEDEILGLERLKMKAVDGDGKLSDKSYETWQPLLYDGKIKIYGSNMFFCQGKVCTFAISKFYIQNSKEEYAIMPIDYDRLNLLNFWKADEKMIESFKFVGNKCAAFNSYLDTVYQKFQNKDFRKKLSSDIKNIRKIASDEAKKEKVDFQVLVGNKTQRYYLDFYVGIVKEYEKNCP